MAKQQISAADILSALGGKDNIAQAAHCATRLRVTTRDKGKINQDALKAVSGVIAVVDGGAQTQIVIGAEINNVYKEFVELADIDEE